MIRVGVSCSCLPPMSVLLAPGPAAHAAWRAGGRGIAGVGRRPLAARGVHGAPANVWRSLADAASRSPRGLGVRRAAVVVRVGRSTSAGRAAELEAADRFSRADSCGRRSPSLSTDLAFWDMLSTTPSATPCRRRTPKRPYGSRERRCAEIAGTPDSSRRSLTTQALTQSVSPPTARVSETEYKPRLATPTPSGSRLGATPYPPPARSGTRNPARIHSLQRERSPRLHRRGRIEGLRA
jgi:hypothetical protein